jgi:hypothetical protein
MCEERKLNVELDASDDVCSVANTPVRLLCFCLPCGQLGANLLVELPTLDAAHCYLPVPVCYELAFDCHWVDCIFKDCDASTVSNVLWTFPLAAGAQCTIRAAMCQNACWV